MSTKSFKTPKRATQPDLAAERKEENIRTTLKTFQAALDNFDNESVTSSVTTSDERRFFALQSDIEKHASWLEYATKENVRVFIYAYEKYHDEDNGIRKMTELIRTEARTVICDKYLKMTVADFLQLEDSECISKLRTKFKLDTINQYRDKMTQTYMSPVSDDDADVDNIQLYVGKFVNVLAKNPQFLDISKK